MPCETMDFKSFSSEDICSSNEVYSFFLLVFFFRNLTMLVFSVLIYSYIFLYITGRVKLNGGKQINCPKATVSITNQFSLLLITSTKTNTNISVYPFFSIVFHYIMLVLSKFQFQI